MKSNLRISDESIDIIARTIGMPGMIPCFSDRYLARIIDSAQEKQKVENSTLPYDTAKKTAENATYT